MDRERKSFASCSIDATKKKKNIQKERKKRVKERKEEKKEKKKVEKLCVRGGTVERMSSFKR